jgi:hypothetical protein
MLSIVALPLSMSDSHWRPRAVAVMSLTGESARIGRVAAGDAPSMAMTLRRDRSGGLLHGACL